MIMTSLKTRRTLVRFFCSPPSPVLTGFRHLVTFQQLRWILDKTRHHWKQMLAMCAPTAGSSSSESPETPGYSRPNQVLPKPMLRFVIQ